MKISPIAYTKMILHAMRHSRSTIHGILLGSFDVQTSDLTINDALPVFHSTVTKPVLEFSLRLALSYCSQKKNGIGVVGWYTCNENLGDEIPGPVALRVTKSIYSNIPLSSEKIEPVLILVKNSGIELMFSNNPSGSLEDNNNNGIIAIQVYGKDSTNNWLNPVPPVHVSTTVGTWKTYIESCVALCLEDPKDILFTDFEDHLSCSIGEKHEMNWIVNNDVINFFDNRGS